LGFGPEPAVGDKSVSKKTARVARNELKTSPWVIGGIVLIAVLVVLVLIQSSTGGQTPLVGAPDLSSLEGIPQGITAEGNHYLGSLESKVVVVEYEDLRCPFCQRHFLQTEPSILEQYVRPGLVRIESHGVPLLGSPSVSAAEALACAAEQGKFWEFRHVAFTRQPPETSPDGRAQFLDYAQSVGVDVDLFGACYDTQRYRATVQHNLTASQGLGIDSTPSFFVNGTLYKGALPFERDGSTPGFREILDQALAQATTP
jgi:protein-disulfide isomerase